MGYHIVVSGYGLWLPGDQRGSWSDAWDERLGFIEPHQLHTGDTARRRMAKERLKHPAVHLNRLMTDAVVADLSHCATQSEWTIAAAAVESTHTHLLMSYSSREISYTIQWLKDRTTRAIHQHTAHSGPVWCKGKWCSYIFDEQAWQNNVHYIERHNIRRGLGARPFAFITS